MFPKHGRKTSGFRAFGKEPHEQHRQSDRDSRRPVATKPFYLASEFMALAAMTVSLFIASLAPDDVDSRLAWVLGVSLVGAYILSRGIAKGEPQRVVRPARG